MLACYMTKGITIRGNSNVASKRPWGGLIESSFLNKMEHNSLLFTIFLCCPRTTLKYWVIQIQWLGSSDPLIVNTSKVY